MRLVVFVIFLLVVACGQHGAPREWCESRTIAQILSLQGSSPGTEWCSTVEHGRVVFRKDLTRCRSGAYYLEDSTGVIFLCDPAVTRDDPARQVKACHPDIKVLGGDTALQARLRVEGLYYPARQVCSGQLLCECQNGLDVIYTESW